MIPVKSFFAELKRRKVHRVAIAYAIAAWLLIQIATQVFPFFEIPNWAVRLIVLVLVLGFPIALTLSWIFDLTPQGIRRTEESDRSLAALPVGHAAIRNIQEKSIAVLPFENLSDDRENEYFAAYELFLRARELFHWAGSGYSYDKGADALRLIDEAIKRDPQFALAYGLASRLHSELFWFGYDKSASRLEKAKAAADAALELQPDLGEAHLAKAFYYYYGFRKYDVAQKHVSAAVRAIPNDADVLNTAGAIARRDGRWNTAVSALGQARDRDPRNLSVLWSLFESYLALHEYTKADGTVNDALSVSPAADFFVLARSAIALFRDGDTAPLHSALRKIPRSFDPGGATSTIALRLCLMERDVEEADRVFAACTHEKLDDNGLSGVAGALDGYTVPKNWYAGLIAQARGNESSARAAFEQAKRAVRDDLVQSPNDAKTLAMLALIHAAVGEKNEALGAATRAGQLLPIAKDSFDGPILATTLAAVSAKLGEKDLAVRQLESLVGVPNGPTPGTLRVEPEWDSLRDDPRFKKLAEVA